MKTLLIFISLLTVCFGSVTAQDIYDPNLEIMPEFHGGREAMYKYIYEHIKYPDACKEQEVSGIVIVQFVVDTSGNLQNPKVVRGVESTCGLNEEALRLVNEMRALPERWLPGRVNGKRAEMNFTLPIKFKLSE